MARLSWGRRPGDDRPVIDLRRRWPVAALLVLALLVSGLDGFVYRSVIQGETPQQIQSKMDQHFRTLERADLFQYELTLDRRSADHTRCKTELFELGPERAAALHPFRLIRVEETGPTTLVRAFVRHRDGVAVEYFRRVRVVNLLTLPPFDIRSHFDVWYLSSPSKDELGGQFITGAGDATLESWAIDRDARQVIERELDAISLEFISPPIEHPEATARPPLRVRLLPAPEYGPNGCVNGAVYDPQRSEILLYPHWADAQRSSVSDRTREQLREAVRQRAGG